MSIRHSVTWRAIPLAGFAGGTVFLLVNLVLTPLLLEVSAGLVLRYIASLVMGSAVLTSSEPTTLIVGIFVNYALAIMFAGVIAVVIHRWGLLVGIIGGGLLGLAIYLINLYTLTLLFDWFFAIDNTILLVSHILFGATAGGVYELFDHYDTDFKLEVKS